MVAIHVQLSGRLKLNGFGLGRPATWDGTFPLALREGSTVRQAMDGMGVPVERVIMTMRNGYRCPIDALLGAGDRVVLV